MLDAKEVRIVKRRILVALLFVFVAVVAYTSTASAAFLCPVVGDGVLNADAHNGDHGVEAITPPVGTSQLPGKNQAGVHANPNAYNTYGPDNPEAGPGGNPDFSPIWP
jgi:hypothetical protein